MYDAEKSCLTQGNKLAHQLKQEDSEGKLPKDLYNHYTIICQDTKGYTQQAYATYFPNEIGEIEGLFDRWVAGVLLKDGTCCY